MIECEFQTNAAGHQQCARCGYVYSLPVIVWPLRRRCDEALLDNLAAQAFEGPRGSGLGDHLALMIDAVGITSARVTWVARQLRLLDATEGCGCDERRGRLNALGERALAWLRKRPTSRP